MSALPPKADIHKADIPIVSLHLPFFTKNILDPTIGNEPHYGDHHVNCDRYPRTNKGQHYRRSVKNRGYFALYVGAKSISE
jgi:hypothetical protein